MTLSFDFSNVDFMERDSKGLAIVIKQEKVRDADLLLTLFTPDRGLLKVYSFGSRKSKKAIKAPLYTEGNFSLYQKGENGQITIKDIDVLSTHEAVFEQLDRITISSLFSELIIAAKDVDAYLYGLYTSSLDGLEFNRAELVASVFIINYLKHLGLCGNWNTCPECGKEYPKDEILGFSSIDRVAVCSECDTMNKSLILPPNARHFISTVSEENIKECYLARISDEQLHRILRYLIRTLSLVLPTRLKTLDSGLLI